MIQEICNKRENHFPLGNHTNDQGLLHVSLVVIENAFNHFTEQTQCMYFHPTIITTDTESTHFESLSRLNKVFKDGHRFRV